MSRTPTRSAKDSELPGLLGPIEPLSARKFVIAVRRLADDLTQL